MHKAVGAGLILAGTIAVGAVIGLLLVAPGGQSTPGTPTRLSTPATPSTSVSLVESELVASGQAIAAAITAGDSAEFGRLTCTPQSPAALNRLKDKWNAAGLVTATMVQPVKVTGDRATVTVHVEGVNGRKDTDFPLRKQDGRWCVPG